MYEMGCNTWDSTTKKNGFAGKPAASLNPFFFVMRPVALHPIGILSGYRPRTTSGLGMIGSGYGDLIIMMLIDGMNFGIPKTMMVCISV